MKINKIKVFRSHQNEEISRFHPVFMDFHRLEVIESGAYPEHVHNNFEIIVVDRGPYQCLLNDRLVRIEEGGFLMIQPGDRHSDIFEIGQCHYVLHCQLLRRGEHNDRELKFFSSHASPNEQGGIARHFDPRSIFRELHSELEQGASFCSYIQDSLLETFFWYLLREFPLHLLSSEFRTQTEKADFIRQLYALFEQNSETNLSIEHISRTLNISRRTLTNYCQKHLHCSPSKAFNVYRMNLAAQHLKTGRLNVQQVSQLMGFDSPFHFSRLFKQCMGFSPKEMRFL